MERHIDSAPGLIDGTADKGWTAISKETYPKWLLQFREGVRNELKWLVVARSPPRRREDSAWRSRGNENSFFPPFPPPHEKLPWGQPAIALENKNSRDGGTQNRKTNLALEMPDANNVTNPMKHFFFLALTTVSQETPILELSYFLTRLLLPGWMAALLFYTGAI